MMGGSGEADGRSNHAQRSPKMTTANAPLTSRPAWRALEAHHSKVRDLHLRQLFADDLAYSSLDGLHIVMAPPIIAQRDTAGPKA